MFFLVKKEIQLAIKDFIDHKSNKDQFNRKV